MVIFKTLNAGNKVEQGNGTTASDWAIMSYVGRLSYNFDSKYLLTANFRADGSSKLAPETDGVISLLYLQHGEFHLKNS